MNTFFLSYEEIKNPLVEELKKICYKKEEGFSISVRYGKRILINASQVDFKNLGNDDFVEIVDYNPVNDIAMIIGMKEPCGDAPIHWLIYSREEINAIAIFRKKDKDKFKVAMDALKKLKNKKQLEIKGFGKIIVGRTLKEVKDACKRETDEKLMV
ncbi:MAG: class II aldolase/adducin family protein [Candidatus Thermoplasmatota archaeon]